MNSLKSGLSSLFALGPMRLVALSALLVLCGFLAVAHPVRAGELLSMIVFGAVTGTYLNPVSVVTQTIATPITAAQALLTNRVAVQLTASADGDTVSPTITHAFAVPATGPTGFSLAGGAPFCVFEPLLNPAAVSAIWWASTKATNTCVFTKNTTAGSGSGTPQVNIHMLRHSLLDC